MKPIFERTSQIEIVESLTYGLAPQQTNDEEYDDQRHGLLCIDEKELNNSIYLPNLLSPNSGV